MHEVAAAESLIRFARLGAGGRQIIVFRRNEGGKRRKLLLGERVDRRKESTHCFWPTRRTRSTPCSTKNGLQFHPRHRASCGITSIPIVLVVNPSFRVKTDPELIAYAKADPGKITMGSPFSVRPAVAPTNLDDLMQRNHQLEPLRGRAAQGARKNAARFKREIEFDRRRPANSLNKSSTQLWLTLDP